MPKNTFFNLTEEKKKRIFNAAILEFSTRRFSEASINQIVKNADISRGSFYQYFNDKEDIYLYIITELGKEKLELFEEALNLNTDLDFFESYLHIVNIGLEWARRRPDYTRIGMLMEIDDSKFIAKLRIMASQGYEMLRKLIERDQKRGLIKPETDPDLIVDLVYTLNIHFLKEYLSDDLCNLENMVNKTREILKIIKEGIAQR
ncbi:MAG: TetR/AcrR family transcriptional regulator [Bacillota bacterium]|nr:TetR/AcrR family transcriptional regulator [Bacillota bacterium]